MSTLKQTVMNEVGKRVKPCPRCSFFSVGQLNVPEFVKGNRGGQWHLARGCSHAQALQGPGPFGSWPSEEEAQAAWNVLAEALRECKEPGAKSQGGEDLTK